MGGAAAAFLVISMSKEIGTCFDDCIGGFLMNLVIFLLRSDLDWLLKLEIRNYEL
jgi:hypothetical protein